MLVFGFCTEDSGVPREWAATASRPGVALLRRLDLGELRAVIDTARASGAETVRPAVMEHLAELPG